MHATRSRSGSQGHSDEPMSLIVLLLVLASVVVFVAAPLVRPSRDDVSAQTATLHLREQRDRAFAALRELEFDHRTGKITDADYTSLRAELRRDAAEALQVLAAAEGSA